LTLSFRPHYDPGFDSTSNRNEYQEYFLGGKGGRCLGLTNLSPSYADCFEIREPQHPGTLWSSPGLHRNCDTLIIIIIIIITIMLFAKITYCRRRTGNVVTIATAYGLDGPGIESRWGQDFPH